MTDESTLESRSVYLSSVFPNVQKHITTWDLIPCSPKERRQGDRRQRNQILDTYLERREIPDRRRPPLLDFPSV